MTRPVQVYHYGMTHQPTRFCRHASPQRALAMALPLLEPVQPLLPVSAQHARSKVRPPTSVLGTLSLTSDVPQQTAHTSLEEPVSASDSREFPRVQSQDARQATLRVQHGQVVTATLP